MCSRLWPGLTGSAAESGGGAVGHEREKTSPRVLHCRDARPPGLRQSSVVYKPPRPELIK